MVIGENPSLLFSLLAIIMISFSLISSAQQHHPPMANLSTTWINKPSSDFTFWESAGVRTILVSGSFVCGFNCRFEGDACLFAVSIFQTSFDANASSFSPQIVWSANRNNPVGLRASLKLTEEGDLILRDPDGTLVWSTNTAGNSVSGLKLTEVGNLVLFDRNNTVVWQSFDHPTNSLLPGQVLVSGQKLRGSVSASNWSEGFFSLAYDGDNLVAYVETNPPQVYYGRSTMGTSETGQYFAKYMNGSFGPFKLPHLSSAQFMQLGHDGELSVYEWRGSNWEVAFDFDLMKYDVSECGHPFVCGEYGICSNRQCTCPEEASLETSYFKPINDRQLNLGCSTTKPISCESSNYHSFRELQNVDYFAFTINIKDTNMETCSQACLKNCSCKAALFRSVLNSSGGDCFLVSKVFSLIDLNERQINYSIHAFLKVQKYAITENPSSPVPRKKARHLAIILGSTLGALSGALLIVGTCFFLAIEKDSKEVEEDYLDQVPGMPIRFSYKNLKASTENFSRKLGEGGFGSVFEGNLPSGTKVAVKRLDGIGQVKKSFVTEVETIGSIHHFNLVKLIGFCAEKSHRLLVFEYMCKGSLDKWIFHRNQEFALGWECRRKIIFHIAKGLAYLHEECRQKICHLDIKLQNILLDENLNAKIADFGMSKLVDRDQSQVVTTMRGTPGYMAPEWLSSFITEKVDVYSFGVVVLEMLCGRKVFDRSQPEEDMHLLSLFKRKAEEEQFLDMVDNHSDDMQLNGAEVVQMMKVAAWCLQSDFSKRPSMSTVVKVLEGVMDVEDNLDYSFSYSNTGIPVVVCQNEQAVGAVTPILASTLSGPR